MSPKLSRFGLVVVLSLTVSGTALAQVGGNLNQGGVSDELPPVKPTGPAAKKADDLIAGYKARIEKKIAQGRKEVKRLRAELHELIDVRYAMTEAIADLRADLATKGTYWVDPVINAQAPPTAASAPAAGMQFHRDFVYGLGSALPKEPTTEQREQLRRLAPRDEVKRMIERLRADVDETRTEVDNLAYKLLELSSGVTRPFPVMGGGTGGMGGGMGVPQGQWFGSIGTDAGMGMQGGMM